MIPINKYIIETKGLLSPEEVLLGKTIKWDKRILKIVRAKGNFMTKDHKNYRLCVEKPWSLDCRDLLNNYWIITSKHIRGSKEPIFILTAFGQMLYE